MYVWHRYRQRLARCTRASAAESETGWSCLSATVCGTDSSSPSESRSQRQQLQTDCRPIVHDAEGTGHRAGGQDRQAGWLAGRLAVESGHLAARRCKKEPVAAELVGRVLSARLRRRGGARREQPPGGCSRSRRGPSRPRQATGALVVGRAVASSRQIPRRYRKRGRRGRPADSHGVQTQGRGVPWKERGGGREREGQDGRVQRAVAAADAGWLAQEKGGSVRGRASNPFSRLGRCCPSAAAAAAARVFFSLPASRLDAAVACARAGWLSTQRRLEAICNSEHILH